MNEDIIKRYKQYLTNAQVKELAAKAERYKLLNAQNRATTQTNIALQRRQAQRGLQNVGLAGREGKLISGQEVARNDALTSSYDAYNRQLRNVEAAQTERQAVRMVNANIEAQRKAAEAHRKIQDAEYQQAEQDYFVEEAKYNARLRKQAQQQAEKQLLPEDYFVEEAKYNARMRQKARAEAQKQYDRDLNQAEQDYFVDEAKYNARLKARNPEAYNAYKQAESIIEQNAAKWDAAINNGKSVAKKSTYKLTQRNTTYEQGSNERVKAIDEMERALSQKNRAAVALKYPQYSQYLMMTDDQFAVSFAAAERLYNKRMQDAAILRKDSSESMDDLTTEASNIEVQAHKEFAPWENAKSIREHTSESPSLGSTIEISDADKTKEVVPEGRNKGKLIKDATEFVSWNQQNWNAVPWANESEWNGQNWKTAKEKGWSASDYKGKSKYDALINEWAYVNGRTALLYTQKFNNVQSLGNFKDLFTDDVTRNKAYHWFRDECMKAFGNYADSELKQKLGNSASKEQMDAMLTLANLMTDEERARFNGMLETYGPKYADEYFEYLYNDVLPQRFVQYTQGQMSFDTRTWDRRVGQSLMSVPTNILQSGQGVKHTLATRQNDPVAAQLGAQKYNMAQSMREAVGQHYGKVGNFLYQTAMSMADSATVGMISGGIGNMFKGLGVGAELAGKIGSTLGGSILGASAFNSSYQEALQKGLSPDKARWTAFGNGVNEMLFEAISLDMLVDRFKNGDMLKVSKNGFVNWFVNTLVQGGVEGSEEVFTDMANNLWDKSVNKIYAEELTKLREYISQGMSFEEAKRKVADESNEQLGMSFLGGALSGGVMGGAAGAMHNIQMRDFERYGAKMDADAKAEVRGFNFKDKQMQELAKQSKLTNQDYGVLAVARDQQLQQNALDYNAKLLKEGKITADVKKLFDRFIENPGLVENQDGGLTDFNGKEVFTAEEVAQMAKYDKYLQNAVDIRGNQDALIQQREEQAQAQTEREKRLDNPVITNEERAQRIGQEFGTPQIGARERIAGDMAFQRGASDAAASSPSVNKSVIEGMKLKDAVTVKGNKVDTKKGVVTFDYGDNKTTDTMTNDQLVALRFAQGMADITGSNIKVESEFVGTDKKADGFYNPKTDTVHINLKGKNSMVYTLAHELTHRIAKLNKAAYADLLKAVKEELSRTDLTGDRLPEMYQEAIGKYMDGETSIMDALRKYEREHYRRNGIILDKDGGTTEVDEEIVCKCCETFLADPRFVQNMVTKHKTGAKAVYSFLKDVYNDMKALFGLAERNADEEGKGNAANISAESDILAQFGNIDRIFKLWSRAVKQMQKVKTQTKQTQTIDFSKMTDEDREAVGTKYSVRTESAPTKTQDVYKLMRLGKDGRLYPLFIDSAEGIDLGVWYNADSPDMSVLKTLPSGVYLIGNDGKDIVSLADYQRTHGEKASKSPSKSAINAAATDGKRWVFIEDVAKGQRRYGGENRKYWNLGINGSGSVSTFAMRPGWHAGSLPTMRQIGKGANRNLRDDTFVWVKGRVSADVDYQAEAAQNPDNDIPTHIPTNGFYMKATNPNAAAAQTDTVGWYIAGAFIADRIIGDAEARSIIDKWNKEHPSDHVEYDYERESGKEFDAESMTLRNKVSTDISTAIENNGVVVDKDGEPVLKVHDHGDGGVQYSYSTWKKEGRDTLKAFMKKDTENYAKKRRKELRESGKSKAEVKAIVDSEVADMRTQYERIMKQMDKIYEISEKYLDKYASFGTWSRADVTVDKDGKPVFSVIRANGEYPMNIDFSLVCVKRRALDAVMNEIVKNGYMEKLVLDGESLVKVNNILRRRGFEVACMGCFVEAKRFRQQKVAEDFAEKYNEIVKSLGGEAAYANFGQDETVKQSEGITGKKDSELNWSRVNELIEQYNKKKAENSRAGMTVEEAIAFELKENPKSRVLLKSGDFMSTRGMDRVAEVAPSILTLYNKQKGTGGPKAVFGDMQYLNDVCKKQWNVNKAYAVGGVRVQSFSDFVPRMFFDYCQMIADLATRKLPAHAYTKEESFVRLYGLTGMKINMSLFPKVGSDGLSAGLQYMRDKNGDIVYKDGKPVKTYAWAGESFNYDVAKEIQADAAYGKNCGTIAVGISDEQIRMMMADPTIRMIIPYHKSSLNPIIAEMMGIQGFTDYTEYQRTKLDGKAIDVDFAFNQRLHEVGDPQAVVKEYLDWCKENGYTAKFEQFAYNEDGSINENYYKLLEDFTLYDEQGNYCPQEAVQTVYPENMDALLDEYLKQDSDMQEARDAMIPAVADEIIRAMDRKASMSNTDFKTDKLGGKEYLKYLQLGTKVVNQTATEAEIKEFKQRMVQLSEDNRMAFLDRLREKLIRADEGAKVRDVRDRQIARLKEEFKESKEKARERRIRSDLTATLKKGNDRIVQLLSRPTENAHVPVQLAQAVSEYAMRLNQLLTTSEPKTGEFAWMEKQTQKGALNAQKILDAYRRSFADEETIAQARAENPKYDPRGLLPTSEYDEQLVKMIEAMDSVIQGKHMSDLTTDEMRLVMNTMRGVIHAVTDANKLIGTNENKTIWKTGDQMVEQFENAPKVSDKLRGYLETSLDLRRLAKVFSGSNENAEFVKLVDQLNKGAIEKERIAQTLQSIFKPVTDKYGEEIRKWYGKNAEWINTGIDKNGRAVMITKGMRVSLAMHVLNSGNMRHIENGGLTIPNREMYRKGNLQDAYANGELVRMNREQIFDIISHMTEAEKAYVEAAMELFHKRTGYFINKTSLALLGYRKAMVDNYFPIHTDKNFTKTDFASLKQDGTIEGQGFLKERVNASNPVYLEDITSVVNRQIRGVALYAGLAIPMRNFNAVMNASIYEDDNGVWSPRTTVKQTLTQKMGAYGAKVVEGFLSDVSEMSHVDVTPMERFAGNLATNYVKAVLLGNMKVALKQVASYPTAAAVIPWKYLVKGLTAGKVDIDLINQYTPLYQMRREGQANEISSIMAKRGLEQRLPWLLGWITKMDVATVGRIWKAAEYMVADQQNLPVGSDAYYQAVAQVFNDTVQQTQPNFTPLQRNAALRSKNPIVRSLVLFGTQRMQNGGILMEAAYELKQSKGKSKAEIQAAKQKLGRAVASQVVQNILLIVASLAVDALRGRMKGWQDEDKEITAESLAKGMGDMFLSNAIGSFLGGSEVYNLISTLYKKSVGDTTYDAEFTVPALDAAETIINTVGALPDLIKYLTGEHTLVEKLKKMKNFSFDLAKAAGYATGIPMENALKDLFKGIIPAIKDLQDWKKTGELIPWLHQSGKLDAKKTSERYTEWVNLGKSGREFFYIDNKLKGVTSRDGRIAVLAGEDIPAEDKARIMVMYDSNGAFCTGSQVFNSKGKLIVDFANVEAPSPIETTLEEIAEASAMPTAEPTAEPTATPNPLSEAKQEGVKQAVAQGVPEQTAFDAFLAYQNMGKNHDDGYSRNDDFREWLFKNVSDPHQRAVLEYQVIGQASKVEGSVTYRESGTVYRDYTNEAWFKLSEHNLAKDGTNKRYEAGKQLEKTGLSVDKTVAIYDGLKDLTKKAEWKEYLKAQGLTDEQIHIFLWSRGWAK